MSNPQAASVESVLRMYREDVIAASNGVYLREFDERNQAFEDEVTRLAEQGAAPQAVQAGEYPPLPDCDETQCIPYSAIRYVSGYTQEYVHAFAKAAIDADRAARVSPAEKTARMLTEGELEAACGRFHDPSKVRASIRKFCEVNAGCRIPADGKLEGKKS